MLHHAVGRQQEVPGAKHYLRVTGERYAEAIESRDILQTPMRSDTETVREELQQEIEPFIFAEHSEEWRY